MADFSCDNLTVAATSGVLKLANVSTPSSGDYGMSRTAGNQLQLQGGSAGFVFRNNANTANLMQISNTGLVSIGTLNPGAGGAPSTLAVSGPTTLGTHAGQADLIDTTPVAVDAGGVINFGGNFNVGVTPTTWAAIQGAKSNATAADASGYLRFFTRASVGVYGERMRIDSAGNVGIGTTSPSYKLDVQAGQTRLKAQDRWPLVLDAGNAGFPFCSMIQFRKFDGTLTWQLGAGALAGTRQEFGLYDYVGGAFRFYVAPAGNVGIGTTDPKKKLHVQSAGPNTQFYLSDAAPSVDLSNHADPDFSTMRTILAMATGAHYGLNAGDAILATYGTGHGNLHINSNYAGIGPTTNVVLQPGTGNVGIGTASPSSKLEVQYNTPTPTAHGLRLINTNATTGRTSDLNLLTFDGANHLGARIYVTGDSPYNWLDQRLTFATQAVGGDAYTDTLTLKNAKVGIGTTNPTERLHVAGNLHVDNDVAIVQDLTVHSSISAGSPSRKIADGSGCYYA